jgi:hypothetical protein
MKYGERERERERERGLKTDRRRAEQGEKRITRRE